MSRRADRPCRCCSNRAATIFHGGVSYAYSSQHTEGNNVDDRLRAPGHHRGQSVAEPHRPGRAISAGASFATSCGSTAACGIGRRMSSNSVCSSQTARRATGTRPKSSPTRRSRTSRGRPASWCSGTRGSRSITTATSHTRFQAWESRLDRIPPIRASTWKAEWQEVRGNSLVMSFLFGRWTWTGGQNANFVGRTDAATAAGVPQGLEIRMGNDESHGGGRPSRFDLTSQWQDGQSPNGGSWNDIWRYHVEGHGHLFQARSVQGQPRVQRRGSSTRPSAFIQGNGDRGAAGQYRLIFTGGAPGQVGTPTQIELYNYPAIPQNNVTFTTAYGSDNWTIARRLTLQLGGRFEHDTAEVPEAVPHGGPVVVHAGRVHRRDSLPAAHVVCAAPVLLVRHHGQRDHRAQGWLGPVLQAAVHGREPDDQPVCLGDGHLQVARSATATACTTRAK